MSENVTLDSLIHQAVIDADAARNAAPSAPTPAGAATPATAPAKPAEPIPGEILPPEDVLDAPESISPEADTSAELPEEPPKEHKVWAELRSKLKQYEQELKAAKEAPKALPDELKTEYEKRIAELEEKVNAKDDEVARLDLARSERFQREYVSKLDGILNRASGLLKQHGNFDADTAHKIVKSAFNKPFAERNRYLMDEAPELHAVLSTMLLQADDQRQVIADALEHHRATDAALQESEQHTKTVSTVKQVEDSLTKAVQELATAGNKYFRKSKGATPDADAWNSNIDLRTQTARQVMLKNNPDEVARYVTKGTIVDLLQKENARLAEKVSKLEEEKSSLVAHRPSVSGRPASVQQAANADGMTFNDLVTHIVNQ